MRFAQHLLMLSLLLLALAACMNDSQKGLALQSAPPTPESAIASPAPVDPSIVHNAEVVRLVNALEQRGITVQNPEESRAAYLYPVPGAFYRMNDGYLYIHPFPSAEGARQRAEQIPAQMTPSVIDWVAKPHYYRCNSALVLYGGTNTTVIQTLTELCGPEFAGS